jgi:hypothetical protein
LMRDDALPGIHDKKPAKLAGLAQTLPHGDVRESRPIH